MADIENSELITAKINVSLIGDQLDKIYAIASTKRAFEESKSEDDADINLIKLLDVICDFAADAKAFYGLENFFEKYIPAN